MSSSISAHDRREGAAWLKRAGALSGRFGAVAAGLTVLDAVAAIGFAAGLSWALTSLPRGVAAAAPGAALALASGAVRGVLGWAALEAGATASRRIKGVVRDRVFRAALDMPPGERASVGETMTAVVEGVEALDGYYARFAPARAAAAVAPLIVAAAMAGANVIAGALVFATFAPFAVAMALAGGAAADEARHQFEALGRLSRLFADRIRALPVLMAYQAEAATAAALGQASEELAGRTLRVLRIAFVSSGALEFFSALSVAVVATYCGLELLGLLPAFRWAPLDMGRAVFVLLLAPEAYAPFRRLAAAYHDQQAADAAVAALVELESRAPHTLVGARGRHEPPTVAFEGVVVRYPGDDRAALDSFDLAVRPGEIVALKGPSGAGKSTVLNLLLGLVSPTAGRVAVNGADVDDGGRGDVAWAGQAPVVVPGDLASNIALSHRDASAEAIAEAAQLSGAARIPGGLDRRIDERGGGLSGGELRRLALARAILRDAPLLLLDEPTANLDAAAEAELIPVIQRMARGRTTLIATHSDAVAAIAHRVVELAA
jgi:ATP-binding cassette subfamily C protein CydD